MLEDKDEFSYANYAVFDGGGMDIVIPRDDPWFDQIAKEYKEYSEEVVNEFMKELKEDSEEPNGDTKVL